MHNSIDFVIVLQVHQNVNVFVEWLTAGNPRWKSWNGSTTVITELEWSQKGACVNCFSYRNVFQNDVNALSKMVLKKNPVFCQKAENFV